MRANLSHSTAHIQPFAIAIKYRVIIQLYVFINVSVFSTQHCSAAVRYYCLTALCDNPIKSICRCACTMCTAIRHHIQSQLAYNNVQISLLVDIPSFLSQRSVMQRLSKMLCLMEILNLSLTKCTLESNIYTRLVSKRLIIWLITR